MPLANSAEASVSPAQPVSATPSKVKRSVFARSMHPPEGVRKAFTRRLASFGTDLRLRLAHLVGDQNLVADRVTEAVEEAGAAVGVAPALGVQAFRVGAVVEEVGPGRVVEIGRAPGPGDMGLA